MIRLLLGLLLTIAATVHAQEICSQVEESRESNLKTLAAIAQLATGGCANLDRAMLQAAHQEYDTLFPRSVARKEDFIDGIKLTGTRDEFTYLPKILGRKPVKDWPDVAKDCSTVVCALSRVFKNEESAVRALVIAKRDGYFISAGQEESPDEKEQVFSVREVRVIDRTLNDLPTDFKRLPTLKSFLRVPDGHSYSRNKRAAAYARPAFTFGPFEVVQGQIVTFSGTFFRDERSAQMTIAHEIAHHYDFTYEKLHGDPAHDAIGMKELSGFEVREDFEKDKDGNPVLVRRERPAKDTKFVWDYGATDAWEDFAVALEYYVYGPDRLHEVDPKKYALLKEKVFGGREYSRLPVKLASALAKIGGPEGLVRACVDQLQSIGAYHQYLWKNGKQSYWINESCLSEKVAEITHYAPEFCVYDGAQGVAKLLFAETETRLKALDAAIRKSTDWRSRSSDSCHQANDFTTACALDAMAGKIAEAAPELSKDTIRQKIDPGALQFTAWEGAFEKRFGERSSLLGCLTERAPQWAGNPYAFVPIVQDCEKPLLKLADARGFKFDNEEVKSKTVKRLWWSRSFYEKLLAFQKAVIDPQQERSCTKETMKTRIVNWARSQQIEETDESLSRLISAAQAKCRR